MSVIVGVTVRVYVTMLLLFVHRLKYAPIIDNQSSSGTKLLRAISAQIERASFFNSIARFLISPQVIVCLWALT